MPVEESKTCLQCGRLRPLDEYYTRNGKPIPRCKPCHKLWRRVWYKANRDGINARRRATEALTEPDDPARVRNRERARRWRERNPERAEQNTRNWRARNRERYNQAVRERYAQNPEKWEIHVRRRAARKAGVEHQPYTRREIYDRDGGVCQGCKKELPFAPNGFQIDHIVPLSKEGPDTPANVQLLCPTCNREKWARTDWTPSQPALF